MAIALYMDHHLVQLLKGCVSEMSIFLQHGKMLHIN